MLRMAKQQTSIPPPPRSSSLFFAASATVASSIMNFDLDDYTPAQILLLSLAPQFFVPSIDPNYAEYAEIILRLGGVLVRSLPSGPESSLVRLISTEPVPGLHGLWGDYLRELARIGRFAPFLPYQYGERGLDHHRQVIHLHQGQQHLQQSLYQLLVDIMNQHRAIATAAALVAAPVLPNATNPAECTVSGKLRGSRAQSLVAARDAFSNDLKAVSPQPTTRPHFRYTLEKDEYILEQVRLHPHLRNTHHLFQELAKKEILRGHTGNSIRSRYRKVLSPRLEYVYQLDARGEPERDELGRLVLVGSDDFPATLKNKFTGDDDYLMCRMARDYLLERDVDIFDESLESQAKFALPYTFFSSLYRKNMIHSLHSWRDRYRKHIGEGTLAHYIEYYDDCRQKGVVARPLLRISDEKVKLEQAKTVELKGERKRNSVEQNLLAAVNSSAGLETSDSSKRVNYNVNDNIDGQLLEHPVREEFHTPPLQAEMAQVAKAVAGATKSDLPCPNFIEPDLVADSTNGTNHSNAGPEDNYSSSLAIEYVDGAATFTDLLENDEIIGNTPQFFEKIRAISSRTHDIIDLYEEFSAIGIKEPLTSHIICATSAVLDLVPLFLRRFVDKLEDDLKHDLGLHMCDMLLVKGEKGIWNAEYDLWLGTSNEYLLEPYFLEAEVTDRKLFLALIDNINHEAQELSVS